MLFRYDFTLPLDLQRFKKQATHYIGQMREVSYDLFLPEYKLAVEIVGMDNSNSHRMSFWIFEIKRDEEGYIIKDNVIVPLLDDRFKEIKDVQELWINHDYKAHIESNSVVKTVSQICSILKLISKINRLKVFA
jgi:hypothetical protein